MGENGGMDFLVYFFSRGADSEINPDEPLAKCCMVLVVVPAHAQLCDLNRL